MTIRSFLLDLIGGALALAGVGVGVLDAKDGTLSVTAAVSGGALLLAGGLLIDPTRVTAIASAIRGTLAGVKVEAVDPPAGGGNG